MTSVHHTPHQYPPFINQRSEGIGFGRVFLDEALKDEDFGCDHFGVDPGVTTGPDVAVKRLPRQHHPVQIVWGCFAHPLQTGGEREGGQ